MKAIDYLQKRLSLRNKIKDSVTVGLAGGVTGTVAMDVVNVLMKMLGISEALYGHLAGSMLVSTWRTRTSRKTFALGQIFHMATGSLLGLPLVWLFKKTGKDHHLLKGAATGFFSWGILHDIGIRVGIFRLKPRTVNSYYSALLQNMVFGMTTAQTIVSIADPAMFKSRQRSQTKTYMNKTGPEINIPINDYLGSDPSTLWEDKR